MQSNVNILILFAHYSKQNKINLYIKKYLTQFRKISNKIIFISNSSLSDKEQVKIKNLTDKIIIRKNEGYDFLAWREGLRHIGYENLKNYDEVILANDSCYAPLFPLEEMFKKMQNNTCDFWGITESKRISKHLQSYFLVFKNKVILSKEFEIFWENLEVINNKEDIVLNYEIKLSQYLIYNNFKYDTYINLKLGLFKKIYFKFKRIINLLKLRKLKQNSYYNKKNYLFKNRRLKFILNFFNLDNNDISICLWDELIKHHSPFLKVKAIRDNPYGLKNVDNWKEVLKSYSDYDINLIKEHLGN
tara:strand:- start:6219 stop:7127 length:909 start_codon:yes stop_codon:yes gene_type:complete